MHLATGFVFLWMHQTKSLCLDRSDSITTKLSSRGPGRHRHLGRIIRHSVGIDEFLRFVRDANALLTPSISEKSGDSCVSLAGLALLLP